MLRTIPILSQFDSFETIMNGVFFFFLPSAITKTFPDHTPEFQPHSPAPPNVSIIPLFRRRIFERRSFSPLYSHAIHTLYTGTRENKQCSSQHSCSIRVLYAMYNAVTRPLRSGPRMSAIFFSSFFFFLLLPIQQLLFSFFLLPPPHLTASRRADRPAYILYRRERSVFH